MSAVREGVSARTEEEEERRSADLLGSGGWLGALGFGTSCSGTGWGGPPLPSAFESAPGCVFYRPGEGGPHHSPGDVMVPGL